VAEGIVEDHLVLGKYFQNSRAEMNIVDARNVFLDFEDCRSGPRRAVSGTE
jgi:hypothetical protein